MGCEWTGPSLHPLPFSPPRPPCCQIDLDVDFYTEVEPHLGRLLGAGGFGRVYEGSYRGNKVAVKIMSGGLDHQHEVSLP